jgi:MOSC domain-containing protein YiiM
VEAVAGKGIAGDRYAVGLGHWSDPRWPDQELTLVAAETAAALGIEVGLLRRNVALAGIVLESLIGATFRLGDAVLLGVRRCDPCRYLDGLTRPGMARALGSRGGLRAHIIASGRISRGDRLMLLTSMPPRAESERST